MYFYVKSLSIHDLKAYPQLKRKNWHCLLFVDIFQFKLDTVSPNYDGIIFSETLLYGIELPADAIGSGKFLMFIFVNNLSFALFYIIAHTDVKILLSS